MIEYDFEPVRGLPGTLPPGEWIVWQASPDWPAFRRSALHARWLALYFAVLVVAALASGNAVGAAAIAGAGVILQGLLTLFAWAVARTTVYTLTNKRLVLRIGVALGKCVNLPLAQIAAADLRSHGGMAGDIALALKGPHRLGYAMLWPHARPWHLSCPQPMLRALVDAPRLAQALAQACAAAAPAGVVRAPAPTPDAAPGPALHGAAA
ncbi:MULTISPECIES: photosynthetic complex putative assembly protein PuhB [unclassified Novosphingobium]|uniref:photosynthetic complex putative assembly protein PuhB n=1 Tax=unclassified Novosphingobium TaxID=2644732 RepID=UPI00146C5E58|nr:hypothetical protein [Novosphingobium sp. SG919]NMN87279.1 hypothetical protein [Novosphingobium sp. SG916]